MDHARHERDALLVPPDDPEALAQAIHRFFHERGYLWVHTPIVTTNDCEGAGEMFRVSTLDLANLPPGVPIQVGETHTFQMVFRDSLNETTPYVSGALDIVFR